MKKIKNLSNRISLALNDIQRQVHWSLIGHVRIKCELERLLNEHTWLFIIGCNNSGTSILQKILGAHPQISTMKREGQIYTNVFRRAKKRGYERVWMEYMDELAVPKDMPLDSLPRIVYDWSRVLSNPIRKVIIEKTPANVLRMGWLNKAFPNSRFLGLVKNGYSVCEGISRKGGKDFKRAALHWNAVNKLLVEKSIVVDNYMELKYEDLCDNHNETAKRLSEFFGVEASPLLDSMNSNFNFMTINGQISMPLMNLNHKSIARLSPVEIETIRENAAEMLDYFNYTPV